MKNSQIKNFRRENSENFNYTRFQRKWVCVRKLKNSFFEVSIWLDLRTASAKIVSSSKFLFGIDSSFVIKLTIHPSEVSGWKRRRLTTTTHFRRMQSQLSTVKRWRIRVIKSNSRPLIITHYRDKHKRVQHWKLVKKSIEFAHENWKYFVGKSQRKLQLQAAQIEIIELFTSSYKRWLKKNVNHDSRNEKLLEIIFSF